MKLKMAKSQLLLNQLRWCFKVHISIDPMESGKLPLVNYFWQIQDGDIQDGVPLLSCVHAPLCPCSYIRPAAISECDIDNIILDSPPCSLLETNVLVVGDCNTFGDLLLSDWYADGSH